MNIIVIGTNHKASHVEVREKLSLTKKGIKNVLSLLLEIDCVKGAVILSTCNRIEFYASVTDVDSGIQKLKEFIYKYYENSFPSLEPYLYTYSGTEAVRHLFKVAGSLDSQVLGETQILGQVRSSYESAGNVSAIDEFLGKIFSEALLAGRKVRRETGISFGSTSIGSVAIDLIKKRTGSLRDKKILIIGVGKVSNLVTKYLYKEEANTVFVSNRTYEKAVGFAKEINAMAVKFDSLGKHIEDADIIISTTACPHTILDKEDFSKYKRPLLIVDLAVPRDVSKWVGELDGIELLCLDNLNEIIGDTINKKKESLLFAEVIVNEAVKKIESEIYSSSFSDKI